MTQTILTKAAFNGSRLRHREANLSHKRLRVPDLFRRQETVFSANAHATAAAIASATARAIASAHANEERAR